MFSRDFLTKIKRPGVIPSPNFSLAFTLVSDPGDEGDCIDLGVATIDLRQIQESEKDFENVPINGKIFYLFSQTKIDFSAVASNGQILAVLTISLKILEAIRKTAKL